MKKYLRVKAAAEMLGVSENTLRQWGADGRINVYRHPISNYRLYKVEELEEFRKTLTPVLELSTEEDV